MLGHEELRNAMRRVFNLGQTYWQQADSESASQHRKADETAARFASLVEETVSALCVKGKCYACGGIGLDPVNRETCIVCGGDGETTDGVRVPAPTITEEQRALARELVDFYSVFTKSSHLWRDGRPLHVVTMELLEAVAGVLEHSDHPLRHYDRTCPACNPAGVAVDRHQAHCDHTPMLTGKGGGVEKA